MKVVHQIHKRIVPAMVRNTLHVQTKKDFLYMLYDLTKILLRKYLASFYLYSYKLASIAPNTFVAASGILVPGPNTSATPASYKN